MWENGGPTSCVADVGLGWLGVCGFLCVSGVCAWSAWGVAKVSCVRRGLCGRGCRLWVRYQSTVCAISTSANRTGALPDTCKAPARHMDRRQSRHIYAFVSAFSPLSHLLWVLLKEQPHGTQAEHPPVEVVLHHSPVQQVEEEPRGLLLVDHAVRRLGLDTPTTPTGPCSSKATIATHVYVRDRTKRRPASIPEPAV